MKSKALLFFILLLTAVLSGCTSGDLYPRTETRLKSFKGQKAALMSPLFLKDLLQVKNVDEIFEKNLFIGNIEFSGGFIVNKDRGMMLQTKNRSFNRQEVYSDEAVKTLQNILQSFLEKEKYNFVVYDLSKQPPSSFPAEVSYSFEKDYREHKDDKGDNINLPWYSLTVKSISPVYAKEIADLVGARYLIAPVIEHFYSHSAGWFNDQKYGCGAGIRFSYYIFIFDLETGAQVLGFHEQEKNIDSYTSKLSEFLIAQEMLKLSDKIAKKGNQYFPRR